jgi:hypothetical protein
VWPLQSNTNGFKVPQAVGRPTLTQVYVSDIRLAPVNAIEGALLSIDN